MTARRYTRAEILALPPATSLAELAGCLGVSEPVIRVMNKTGQLEALGITVNRIGSQHRVITSTVWAYLGLRPDFPGASTGQQDRDGRGEGRPAASALRSVRGGGAA